MTGEVGAGMCLCLFVAFFLFVFGVGPEDVPHLLEEM